MKFLPTLAIALRYYYLLKGSVARLLPLFVWFAIDIVLWGFITKYLHSITGAFTVVSVLLGAVLLWNFLVRVMQGVITAFLEDVWSRNFLNIFASPLSISEYLCGLVISSCATSVVVMLLMLAMAGTFFGISFVWYGATIVPFLFILFLFGISLGVLGCALVLRFGPPAEWLVWPIPALISPFVGVFYPLAVLPAWMQAISHALPASYVFEAMRAMVNGESVLYSTLLGGIGLAAAYLLLACWILKRVYQRAVRTGLIARYSAESIN